MQRRSKPHKAESAGNAKAFQQVLLFFVYENIQANINIGLWFCGLVVSIGNRQNNKSTKQQNNKTTFLSIDISFMSS